MVGGSVSGSSDARAPGDRRGALVLAAIAILVLAAAFVVRERSRGALDLPRFALTVLGGSPVGPRVALAPDAYVRVELRPERATEEEIAVSMWLLRGGVAQLVTGALIRGPDGSIRVEGPRAELFPSGPAQGELVVFVGPADRVPREPERAAKARTSPPDDVQVFTTPLELR